MKLGVSVNGIRPETRETAMEAARRSGVSLADWLNAVIIQQAENEGVAVPSLDEHTDADALAAMNQRLDDLTHRIERLGRSGPEAYAPKHIRDEPDQLAELAGRLDRRLDQFASVPPPDFPPPIAPPRMTPAAMPSARLPPSLDHALAEIAARQRMLNGNAAATQAQSQSAPPAAAPAPIPMPMPNLSGLEDQLRNITTQIETLRQPGIEQAINALRDELAEIAGTLSDAMPRRVLDSIENQIQELNQRIAEGRQAGADTGALTGIEHGLAEVRDALHGLTPADNLIGFTDAIAGLAHKIDLIVAQRDPATMAQLESAIATLREMSTHIASNEAVRGLAAQVQELGEKVEHMAGAGTGDDAFNHLEQRIGALSDVLAERAHSGSAVPPRLEALVESLADKIEQIQKSRDSGDAFGHLEERIVSLVEKLDASDSRLSHLEAIERGLADLLMHVEANKDSGPRAVSSPDVDGLKSDVARTHDALEAVHGTLGDVVDRLAMIEQGIRGDARPSATTEPSFGPPAAPPPADPAVEATRHLPPAPQLPIDSDLQPDQPLEPGSGPPPRPNPAARIAASEAALGGSRPDAAPGGQSGFIAAARRAAQAAVQDPGNRARPQSFEAFAPKTPSLRAKMMTKVKSLFVAASIIAIVVGSVQIAGKFFNFGKSGTQSVQTPVSENAKVDTAVISAAPRPAATVAANPPALSPAIPALPTTPPLMPPSGNISNATIPPSGHTPAAMQSLFAPPMFTAPNSDVTGSIPRQTSKPTAAAPKQPAAQPADRLPAAIGGPKLRSAAVAGDGAAAYEIAVRYAEGRGVPADQTEAAHWFERAADKGLTPAQFRYASQLEKGLGVKKDLPRARKLYLAAAAKGNGKAMHNLAVLYAEGIDGKPDYISAAQWFHKAALRNIADSQYNLGVLCARGLGVGKSYTDAYKWFALAANQGDKESAKKRDDIATHMDAAEMAAAQASIKSFVAEPQPSEATVVAVPPGGWDQATGATPNARARPAGPLALGAFEVGKR
jgi:localization factor PodJL